MVFGISHSEDFQSAIKKINPQGSHFAKKERKALKVLTAIVYLFAHNYMIQ